MLWRKDSCRCKVLGIVSLPTCFVGNCSNIAILGSYFDCGALGHRFIILTPSLPGVQMCLRGCWSSAEQSSTCHGPTHLECWIQVQSVSDGILHLPMLLVYNVCISLPIEAGKAKRWQSTLCTLRKLSENFFQAAWHRAALMRSRYIARRPEDVRLWESEGNTRPNSKRHPNRMV